MDATITDMANRYRNLDTFANLTEEELRKSIIWKLKNDPELIPGLKGEEMPTIRNTERIEKALTIKHIKNDKDWLTSVEMYAALNALTTDNALLEEANRVAKGKPLVRDEVVFDTATYIQMKKQEIMQKWKLDPNIMQMLQQKAKERNLPLDTVFKQDIDWVINQQIEKGQLFP